MQVNHDQSTVSPLRGVPVQPATPLPAAQVADVGNAEKRSRQDQRRNPNGSPARFRSILDAATVAGLGQAPRKAETGLSDARITQPTTEITRNGRPSRELNAQDSEALFRAARAYASAAKKSGEGVREAVRDDEKPSAPAFKHVALSASRRYAESFLALDRTFAARGETLEVST